MDPNTRAPSSGARAVGPERCPRRDRLHAAVLTVPWALIVVLWWRALAPRGLGALGGPGLFVALCAVVTIALTAAWVAHNLAIHRARGPRMGLPAAELAYQQDWTGRPVVADWSGVRGARVVFVAGAGRHKAFVPARVAADRAPDRPLAGASR